MVAALALGLLLVALVDPSGASQAATPQAVLSVNDVNAVGAVGDGRLSLSEALQIASGTRSMGSLSAQERQRVSGDARHARGRIVRITLGRGRRLEADAPLPLLVGLSGVVIDGGGAVMTGTTSSNGTAFAVASSQLTIRDFGITGFGNGVTVVPAGVKNISSVTLDRLVIAASSSGISITGADGSGSIRTVRNIRITRCRIKGAPGGSALTGVNIVGQSGTTPALVDGVEISDTWFGGDMLERIQLVGVQALASATATGSVTADSQLRNVTIRRNTFTTCPDPCVLVYSALALAGQVTGAGIRGLRIEDNDMSVNGLGVTLMSGYTLATGTANDSRLEEVLVRGNVIRPVSNVFAGRCQGIVVIADWTDFHAGASAGNIVEGVRVDGNHVSRCARGLLLAGTFAGEEVSGSLRDNTLAGVRVRGNTFESNTTGVEIVGVGLDYGRIWGNSPTHLQAAGAVLTGNAVRDVVLDSNQFFSNATALLVAGSAITDTNGHVVLNNMASSVKQLRPVLRQNQRDCRVVDDLRQNSQGVGMGNTARGVVC